MRLLQTIFHPRLDGQSKPDFGLEFKHPVLSEVTYMKENVGVFLRLCSISHAITYDIKAMCRCASLRKYICI